MPVYEPEFYRRMENNLIAEKIRSMMPQFPQAPTPEETKQAWGQVYGMSPEGSYLPFAPNINLSALTKAMWGTISKLSESLSNEFIEYMSDFIKSPITSTKTTEKKLLPVATQDVLNKISHSMQNVAEIPGADIAFMPPVGIFVGPKATGFAKAPAKFSSLADKMPRFEISDIQMRFKKPLPIHEGIPTKLGDVIEHNELFENYPEIKDFHIYRTNQPGKSASFSGTDKIQISRDSSIDDVTHEIQHYIQEKEGFAKGGSPEYMAKHNYEKLRHKLNIIDEKQNQIWEQYKEVRSEYYKRVEEEGFENAKKWFEEQPLYKMFSDLQTQREQVLGWMNAFREDWSQAFERYRNLAGEIEARDAAARMALTSEQRLRTSPYSSEDIPLKDWIIRK